MDFLFFAVCIGVVSGAIGQKSLANNGVESPIAFDKPGPFGFPSKIPLTFTPKVNVPDLERYPIGVEAVLSVALKLQALENRYEEPRNFLVSPLAVAGALGQLMLGAQGDLRNQLAVLLTLRKEEVQNGSPNVPIPDDGKRSNSTLPQQVPIANVNPLERSRKIPPQIENKIRVQNAEIYEAQNRDLSPLPSRRRDGLPGLELHRQLGGLIQKLSSPLRNPGIPQNTMNSSYLHTGSAFFVNNDLMLNEPFVRALVDFYDSKIVPLDFSRDPAGSQTQINTWGSKETGGLIKKFLESPPQPDTAVVQAVAVHFRGAWETPFIPEATIPGQFMSSEKRTVPVNFMRGSLEEVPYAESQRLGLRLLAMPYAGSECAMYIVFPMENNPLKYRVGNIASQLSGQDIAELVGSAKRRTVNVIFPKLSLTSSLSMTSALKEHADYMQAEKESQMANNPDSIGPVPTPIAPSNPASSTPQSTVDIQMGRSMPSLQHSRLPISQEGLMGRSMPNAVNDKKKVVADDDKIVFAMRMGETNDSTPVGNEDPRQKPILILDGAASDSRFRVSDVIQQIALEINEAGTEAAAIAGSTINYSGDVKNFKVNRPFLFFIRQEQTNAILFWGTIVDPTA